MHISNDGSDHGDRPLPAAILKPRRLVLLGMVLVAAGLGLGWLSREYADLPAVSELVDDVRLYLPAMHADPVRFIWQDHVAGADGWKLANLRLNGQWDARVLGISALAFQLCALAGLGVLLGRHLGTRWIFGLMSAALIVVAVSPLAPRPDGGSIWASVLLALSTWHLALNAGLSVRGWRLWLGLLIGVVGVIAATAGMAASAALVIWAIVATLRGERVSRVMLAGNAALVAAGVFLAVIRSGAAVGGPSFFESWPAFFAWPFRGPAWSLVLWSPAVICLLRWNKAQHPAATVMRLVAIWAILQTAIVASLGIGPASAHSQVLLVGLVVNAACLGVVFPADRSATRVAIALALWMIAVGDGLLNPAGREYGRAALGWDEFSVAALRQSVADGDTSRLRELTNATAEERDHLAALLQNPAFRGILPPSVRAPHPIVAEPEYLERGFRRGAAPALPGLDDLPVLGTWGDDRASTAHEFVSRPIAAIGAVVQIRVAGTLEPPATSLVLRTAAGKEIRPLEEKFSALGRWKRLNFPAPSVPFRIVARDASATTWIAFTAPQDIGGLSRLATKLVRTWKWWFVLGLGALVAAVGHPIVSALRKPDPAGDADRASFNWSVLPWLALLAYAVFFSHHLDLTAGVNDSGGYLNSAKTLVRGDVSATPRELPEVAAVTGDLALYLPTTFHPAPDGRMAPEYPVGFPLTIWAVAKLSSLSVAVPFVILFQLVLGVIMTRQLAKTMGLPNGWAWLAAAIIGLSPVYLFQALQPQSDGPALVWVTAAVYWAWNSRERPWQALLAGLATALAVLIRPSNALCFVPILICLAGHRRQLVMWMLAGLPGAAWWMWYNQTLYGHALTTGYGEVFMNFGPQYILPTLKSYARWLPIYFTPVVLLALVAPFSKSIGRTARWMLASWIAVFAVFYAFYWCTWDNWYNMRFLLPAAPAMVVLGLLLLRSWLQRREIGLLGDRIGPRSTALSALLVGGLLSILIAGCWDQRVVYWMHANRVPAVAALWMREHLPSNAVVFAKPMTNSLMYYTDFSFVRSDHPLARSPAFVERLAAAGRPIHAVTFHWEERGFKWGAGRGSGYPDLPGRWERRMVLCEGEVLVWTWRPDNKARQTATR